jgi:hypothetical protein
MKSIASADYCPGSNKDSNPLTSSINYNMTAPREFKYPEVWSFSVRRIVGSIYKISSSVLLVARASLPILILPF